MYHRIVMRRLALMSGTMLATAATLAVAGSARAAEDSAASGQELEVPQIVITSSGNHSTVVVPARGTLAETEPQAIITRQFIEESAPRVGDFTNIAMYAPSMVTIPNPNGPGLGDGGKISMRGFSDGSYNVTYDGIPWGDTNGPSHHATAFFTSSTIGGVIIDRGPGSAGDFGQANFGGSINLFSLPLEPSRSATQVLTYGSWNTKQSVTTLQSGKVDFLHDAQFVANFQANDSDGYLSNTKSNSTTELIKGAIPLTADFKLTMLYTHTNGFYNKSDIGDASVAQTTQFGSNFALGSDPTLQDYAGFNWVKKNTNFEYGRLEGDLGAGFGVSDTLYSYDYDNNTLSGLNNLAAASANVVIPIPAAAYPAPGKGYSTTLQTYGIPGYHKKNEYWVTGDILKFTKDTDFGTLTTGSMVEMAQTVRDIFDVNLLNNQPTYSQKAATSAGPSGVYVDTPLSTQYYERSGWHQFQPFVEFAWKPLDGLTISPSVKYVHFELFVHAPVEALANGPQPLYVDKTYTKTLPFLTVNYRIDPDWSAYAQYAQGFLVPKIGNLYVANVSAPLVPQESTNYQIGTVLNFDKFVFDGDLYYINFTHKIQTFTDSVTGQNYDTNTGGAYYRGIELEGAYGLPFGASIFANWSLNQAIGSNDPTNPLYNGHQLTSTPGWTAALGARFERDNLLTPTDSVIVTLNNKWIGSQYVTNASCKPLINGVCNAATATTLTPVTGLLPSILQTDLALTYRIGSYSIEAQIMNLLDNRGLTVAKGSALIPGTNLWAQTVAQGGANNALEYQVPRNFELTLKVKI